jgi:hypothetical protein
MGFDLRTISPSEDAPVTQDGEPTWGRYNQSAWAWLAEWLVTVGVDITELVITKSKRVRQCRLLTSHQLEPCNETDPR